VTTYVTEHVLVSEVDQGVARGHQAGTKDRGAGQGPRLAHGTQHAHGLALHTHVTGFGVKEHGR